MMLDDVARARLMSATWDDLTEAQPEDFKTHVERAPLEALPDMHQQWRRDGVLVFPKLLDDGILDEYTAERSKLPKDRAQRSNFWAGWHYATPYMHCEALRVLALHPNIWHKINALIGEPMGLHLALTGFVSTERAWHQDTYLNPDYLWSYYLAVWIALDDVDPDSGPFEFVPGSHLWPALRRERLFRYMTPALQQNEAWPSATQNAVGEICEREIERRGARTARFIPKKGDVLVWHSNLMHRGSLPKNPALERRALICHYSAITRRFDMPRIQRDYETGGLYFHIEGAGPSSMG
jgi:hypothetical protein